MPAINRRQALTTLAAGTLAALPTARAGKPQAASRGITLGMSTYGAKGLKTEQTLKLYHEIGFDAVEMAVMAGWDADSANLSADRRRELRKQLEDSGLQLRSLMEHVHPTDEKQQAVALERLKLAAGVAHDLSPAKPPIVQTTLGGSNWQREKDALRERLAKWVDLAKVEDVMIAIKPHRGGGVSQPAEAVWLIEQLDRPERLRMVYDYSHYAFRNLPLEATVRTALPYTVHVVFKDAVEQNGKVVFQLPGEAGTIDFVKILELFAAAGYDRDVNCEVSGMVWGQKGYDPVAAARTCYANIAPVFEKAKVARPSA